jgi:hypothetical protein
MCFERLRFSGFDMLLWSRSRLTGLAVGRSAPSLIYRPASVCTIGGGGDVGGDVGGGGSVVGFDVTVHLGQFDRSFPQLGN